MPCPLKLSQICLDSVKLVQLSKKLVLKLQTQVTQLCYTPSSRIYIASCSICIYYIFNKLTEHIHIRFACINMEVGGGCKTWPELRGESQQVEEKFLRSKSTFLGFRSQLNFLFSQTLLLQITLFMKPSVTSDIS